MNQYQIEWSRGPGSRASIRRVEVIYFYQCGGGNDLYHVVMVFLTFGMFGLLIPVIAIPGAAYTSAENVLVHYLRP